MKDDRYDVILRYDPENSEIHGKVVACLSRIDPRASARFENKKLAGSLIVKRSTDLATAKRITRLLRDTGADCSIQKLPAESPADAGRHQAVSRQLSASQQETGALLIKCPKCGYAQPPHVECRACGVIMAKAKPPRKSAPMEVPPGDNPPSEPAALQRILTRMRQATHPVAALIRKIEHPIRIEKLTTWARRVGDRLIRCALVFIIALILQTGLLALGKMLWFLYISTTVGQYYLKKLPEKAEMFERIVHSDPLTYGWETTLTILCAGLLLGCAAQLLHLIRYLYLSQGIVGKLILWFIPSAGLTARVISQQPPFPDFALAVTLVAVPILCMLSSCLYLAQTLLPELGDFRKIVTIIAENRVQPLRYVIKKIRLYLDGTKKAY